MIQCKPIECKLTSLAYQLGLYPDGLLPATEMSAAIDLQACIKQPITVWPDRTVETIPTGIHIWTDQPLAVILLPRSSSKIQLANTIGLIDPDYQGELLVKCRNPAVDKITIEPGQRFIQAIFVPILLPAATHFKLVESFSGCTDRANGGFGSTGKSIS